MELETVINGDQVNYDIVIHTQSVKKFWVLI